MPLYTEEQLSMILSAHADKRLIKDGVPSLQACDGYGCINQIAFREPNPLVAMYCLGGEGRESRYVVRQELLARHARRAPAPQAGVVLI